MEGSKNYKDVGPSINIAHLLGKMHEMFAGIQSLMGQVDSANTAQALVRAI